MLRSASPIEQHSEPPIGYPPGGAHGSRRRPTPPARDDGLVVILDALQQNWTELGYRQELAAYHGACRFRSARTVLAANVGNGRYLSEIARHFPEKRYFGFESDPRMMERAVIRYGSQGIDLQCRALDSIEGRYDAVILRSLINEPPCTRDTLDTLAELTNVGGSAFVIEPLDSQRYFQPSPRRVVEFLAASCELRGLTAEDSGIAQTLGPIARSHPAWNPSVTLDVVLPSTLAANLSLFEETYALIFELAERVMPERFDYDALREEWAWWCQQNNRYTQAALRVFRLDRI
ncbi:MAG: class I SAM-dependent methyltransferase [Rhodothermales bacterium]|nr:class I SAM-dependent methyltransferase [Rhodothermales bacterium]